MTYQNLFFANGVERLGVMLGLLVLCGCLNSPEERPGIALQEPEKNYKLIFTDTVVLEDQEKNIQLVQRKGDELLGYSDDDYSVFVFSIDGKIKERFSNFGEGPNKHGEVYKLGFLEDRNIAILDVAKLRIYDRKGNFIRTCSPDNFLEMFPYTGSGGKAKLFSQNEHFIGFASHNDRYSQETPKEYFGNCHYFTLLDFESCTFKNFGQVEKGSVYRSSNRFFVPLNMPIFAYNRELDICVVKLPLEKKMYFHHLGEGKQEAYAVDLKPGYFPESAYGAKDPSPEAQLIVLQKNSFYHSMAFSGDRVYLLYTVHRGEDKIYESAYEENAVDDIFFNRKSYLEIYNTKGDKLCDDIFISSKKIELLDADISGKLTFFQSHNFEGLERNIVIYADVADVK